MNHYLKFNLIFILSFLVSSSAIAQTKTETKNLKSLSVTESETTIQAPDALNSNLMPQAIFKPLDLNKTIIPLDTIPEFAELSFFMGLRNEHDINRAKKIVTQKPDQIPPLAYYYLSNALVKTNDSEAAAFYYYLAELRNEFDKKRFPPFEVKSGYQDLSKTKSKDQISAPPTRTKNIIDPRSGFNDITEQLGRPVRAWIVKNPASFKSVLARVELFDKATAYNYRPPYDLSRARDIKDWANLLKSTREEFFQTQRQIADQLKSIEAPQAARPFGRP